MERVLDKIIKYGLYLLVFLFPFWFLPWTISPVAFNKQILLAVFVFLLLILWLVKIISSGKLSFVWNKLNTAVILLLLVLGISTIFSSARIQSFWGMADEPDTFFNFILYGLVFFLFANLISANQLKSVLISFLAGSGILSLLFLIQCFKPIFPWGFAQSSGFNSIGSIQSLAVFLGGAFLILMSLISINQPSSAQIGGKIILRRLMFIFTIILGILLFVSLLAVNYWAVWLGIVFGAAIIVFSKLKNISANQPLSAEISGVAPGSNPLKPLFLPLFIFALALVFIFLKLPVGSILALPSEINLTYPATFDIAKKTLEEGPKNLVLGSGPATFSYQYSLHRGTGLNLTDFWQIRFNQGAAVLPTFLTTFGILGILMIFLMMAVFFYSGFRTVISGNQLSSAAISSIVGGFYFLILWFFYSANFSLMFAGFLMIGLFTASIGSPKEFSFTQSPQKAFFIMLVGVFLIAGSIFGLYTVSKKYAGAISYSQGLNLINAKEPKLDEGIIAVNKAATLDPKDSYFRNLSQVFLFKINEVLNDQKLSQEQKQTEFQKQVSNAELSAIAAVKINPRNSQNWLQLGNVYENLALVKVSGAEKLAILNYQKAAELDPQNPQIPFNLARVYFVSGNKDEAKAELEKSLELKSNFQPAIDLLSQIETKSEK